jgi:hypothetical protein
MPLMTLAEPLFLLLALGAIVFLLAAAGLALAGRPRRAVRILARLGVVAGLYLTTLVLVSILTPRRTYRTGDTQCFDDWCIAVVGSGQERPQDPYSVRLRLSSRARRAPMGEKGTVVYLEDDSGRRYDPVTQADDLPFDTVLQPGESVTTSRAFDVPPAARGLGLVYTHEGGFPIWWLVIGEGGWFAKPPIVRLE